MFKATGPGKAFIQVDKPLGVVRIWLLNFDVEGADVKPEHTKVLADWVAPVIRSSGTVKLMGLASTTGSIEFNKNLAQLRLKAVESDLRRLAGPTFTISKAIAPGELMAQAFKEANWKGGTDDNTESALWRAVVINAWNRRGDPVTPPIIRVPIGSTSDWVTDASQILDKAGIAVGIVDMLADFALLSSASFAVAAVTGPLGLAISSLQTIVGMPVLWHSVELKARFNGKVQGAADALQDVANQFSDPSLDAKPLSRWPAIQIPEIHTSGNPQPTTFQAAWLMGQRLGRDEVVKMFVDMEQHPKPFKLPDGKTILITGRIWSRLAFKKFGDNVGIEFVIKPVNQELKARGEKPWPTF